MQTTMRGIPYLVAYAPIKTGPDNSNRWVIAMAHPVSSAFKGSMLFSIVLFFLLAGLVILILSGRAVTKTIIRPLQTTAMKIDEIAAGDLRRTTPLPVLTTDEVGQVAASFNAMLERIQDLIIRIAQSCDTENNGRANVTSLAGSARRISTHAATLSQMADDSVTHVQEGHGSVNTMVKSIEGIKRRVDEMTERVSQLGEKSQQIGTIVELIDDIARQTNLLALNAAIEAARAGDQGKGFAVVASEVRHLAERSLASTKSIESLVFEIQGETQSTIEATQEARSEVDKGTVLAQQAGTSLSSLANIVESTRAASKDICDATTEQQEASDEVATSIAQIQDAISGYHNQHDDPVERPKALTDRAEHPKALTL